MTFVIEFMIGKGDDPPHPANRMAYGMKQPLRISNKSLDGDGEQGELYGFGEIHA